jgi:hypothetical protein
MFQQDSVRVRSYRPPRLTPEQVGEIEQAIWKSEDAAYRVKPLLIWMLRQSDCCTKRVVLTLLERDHDPEYVREFQEAVHDMVSDNGFTHLDDLFIRFQTQAGFSHHYGTLVGKNGRRILSTEGKGRTVWVSWIRYDDRAKLLKYPGVDVLASISHS